MGALLVIGLAFCAVGYLGLVAPNAILDPIDLVWKDITSRSARNELTAMYGGMHAALGIFFVIAAFVPSIRLGALLAASAFLGGLVAGRIVSLVRDGLPGLLPMALLVVELMGVLLAMGAVLKRRSVPEPAAVPAAPAPAPTQPIQS
jgi:hypothetical protein